MTMFSVSSSSMRSTGTAYSSTMAFTLSGNPSRCRCRREKLHAMGTTGSPWANRSSRRVQAWRSTCRSISVTKPFFSNSGMKSFGCTTPRSGDSQRTSASRPTMRFVASSTFGW